MKKILFFIILFSLILIPFALNAAGESYIERDLPNESALLSKGEAQNTGPTLEFTGYLNSMDVTTIGGVVARVYYFCGSEKNGFCSDEEGILVVSGADTGKILAILKALNGALENRLRLTVWLSGTRNIAGVKEIVDIKLWN